MKLFAIITEYRKTDEIFLLRAKSDIGAKEKIIKWFGDKAYLSGELFIFIMQVDDELETPLSIHRRDIYP